MSTQDPTGPVPCDKHRILITDDEAPVRNIFRLILTSGCPACIVDLAANGLEAVESFQQFHQGVLLMDAKMPVMDGQAAFYKIRDICQEKGWEMPSVIFCTGFAPSAGLKTVSDSGQKHCILQKPVPSELLLTTVKSRLDAPVNPA